ncbi:MAG: DUF397 domain-containing protein [Actinocatenispora sp.]
MSFENWRKSSRSQNSAQCIYVARDGDTIAIRESEDPDGTVTITDRTKFAAFVAGVKAGEFDDML